MQQVYVYLGNWQRREVSTQGTLVGVHLIYMPKPPAPFCTRRSSDLYNKSSALVAFCPNCIQAAIFSYGSLFLSKQM